MKDYLESSINLSWLNIQNKSNRFRGKRIKLRPTDGVQLLFSIRDTENPAAESFRLNFFLSIAVCVETKDPAVFSVSYTDQVFVLCKGEAVRNVEIVRSLKRNNFNEMLIMPSLSSHNLKYNMYVKIKYLITSCKKINQYNWNNIVSQKE